MLKLNPDLVFREDNDGGLIFDPATGDVQVLNETAAFICRSLDGTCDVQRVAELLLAEFEIEDAEAAKLEMTQFVDGLRQRGMLVDA